VAGGATGIVAAAVEEMSTVQPVVGLTAKVPDPVDAPPDGLGGPGAVPAVEVGVAGV